MANFSNLTFTNQGKVAQSYAQVGWALCNFTMIFDSHLIPSGYTPATMTAGMAILRNPMFEKELNKIERDANGNVIFGAVMSNESLTADFAYRALGLICYAESGSLSDGTYQTVGPFLLAYANAGSEYDTIPAYDGNTVMEKQVDIVLSIGNDAAVNLTLNSGAFVTQEQVSYAIANRDRSIVDTTTGLKYKLGVDNGLIYVEEVE